MPKPEPIPPLTIPPCKIPHSATGNPLAAQQINCLHDQITAIVEYINTQIVPRLKP